MVVESVAAANEMQLFWASGLKAKVDAVYTDLTVRVHGGICYGVGRDLHRNLWHSSDIAKAKIS